MALIKNEFPILEYDTDSKALIMPGHHWDYKFCEKAVMLFMEAEIEEFVATHDCEIVGKLESITKKFYVYKTIHNGTDIVFVQAPLGGAGAVQILDQLIAGGVNYIIAAGCCGALVEDMEGDFFIPTAALRQEGTSYHYVPPTREIELDEQPILALERTLNKAGLNYKKCKTWTTDGFYRETKEMVLYRKNEGYSVVEMECASMAACARMRGVAFGQLLFTADSLANVDMHNIRNWGLNTFTTAMELAMNAVTELKS
ncbi:nucleoside phosphorylase [Anaerosacchariphilus polymeriproducens]|uniref:Uridine phosphorylase n=1 Tax=Anaerosacchariphilus polymeriproducens TaxID=1812858 RepID=A0A371AVQ9_9FIRM|nr:nucleoside phosphorylase [Anaerosacchariphilus polymeriproducens]RDU23657.1 phosphorylase [Anaerosacchariphilus polymeriproducens]